MPFLPHMIFHVFPARHVFFTLAALAAVFGVSASVPFALFLLGVTLGWRRAPRNRTLFLALIVVAIGAGAACLRAGALYPLAAAPLPALAMLTFAAFGHALGAVIKAVRDAAATKGAQAARRGGQALSAPPASAAVSTAWGARDSGVTEPEAPRGRGERMASRAPVALPKGWTPTVSPRRRGLFG